MKTLLSQGSEYYLSDNITQKCYPIDEKFNKLPNQIYNDQWVIYGRFTCPYCVGAVEFLKEKGHQDIVFVDITKTVGFSKNEVLQKLNNELNGQTTVPIVFHKGKFVGGFDDLKSYLK